MSSFKIFIDIFSIISNMVLFKVIVSDKDSELTGRYCGTWNDPQYMTADGKYFTYHGCGEHVLYRNKRYPYWVYITNIF